MSIGEDKMVNSEDPDQTAPLHCFPRPLCPKTLNHYSCDIVG